MATDNNSIYHGTDAKIISQVSLPDGNTYEIHDPKAIHDVSELGLSSALAFKGTKPTEADLPTTGNKVGDVWLVTDKNQEYVWVEDILRGGKTGGTLVTINAYAYLATTKTYSVSQFVGKTAKFYDDYNGDDSMVIANSNIVEQTANGITIDLGNYRYIWVAYVAGYKNLPSVGTYLSYCDGYDNQRVVSVDIAETKWEPLGSIHDAASSTHTHPVTVSGTNSPSTVTGTAVVPTVDATHKYLYATIESQQIDSNDYVEVLTSESTFGVEGGEVTNKYISANVNKGVEVEGSGSATVIKGFDTHTTATAITGLSSTAINNPTVDPVTIPNVTGNTKVTASKVTVTNAPTGKAVNASVVNGVLNLSEVTIVTSASSVSAEDVEATKVTLGSAISASKVTTTQVNVYNSVSGTANAITNLGAFKTESVLTGVKVKTQPEVTIVSNENSGDVAVASGIEGLQIKPDFKTSSVAKAGAKVTTPNITLKTSDITTGISGYVQVATKVDVDTGYGDVTGTAAAQAWEQSSGSTGAPNPNT